MPPIKHAASEFLAHKRVAVTGVSRKSKGHGCDENEGFAAVTPAALRGIRSRIRAVTDAAATGRR